MTDEDLQVYVIKRRGNYYGAFHSIEAADEYRNFLMYKETDTRFKGHPGRIHMFSLKAYLRRAEAERRKQ